MTGEPMHNGTEMALHAPIIVRKVKYPLHFVVSYVSRTVQKAPLKSTHIPKERNGAVHPSYINYHLKSEVSITLCCRLCSTRYVAV